MELDRPVDIAARRNDRADNLALVTGASGFTGGHLARALLRRGYRVRALVRSRAKAGALERAGAEIAEGDLTQARDVDKAVKGCSQVYHIAALYRQAKYPDHVYYDVNVGGTRHVLEAASRHGVERVIHCSTGGVHGDIKPVPADEDAPFNPGDVYQESKLQGELAAREAFTGGLPGAIVRPAAIYGPSDLRFLKLFRSVRSGLFCMFGRGETTYHLVYIDDLVEGIVLCGEHPDAIGETFILAGPRYTTINELVAGVAAAVGVPPPRVRIPLMPLLAAAWLCETACKPLGLEPPLHRRRCGFFTKARGFSSAKARRLLGYAPAVDLDDGLRATAAQYVAAGYLPPSLASATASGFRARIRVSLVRGRRSYGTLAPLASLPLC
jgi:nucleoside-diphosphate-sugar epimerase